MQSKDAPHSRNLSDLLLEAQAVTLDQVESALTHQKEQGGRFGEALVQTGGATEMDVCWALSRQLGMSLVDLLPETLDVELIRSFPEHCCVVSRRSRCFATTRACRSPSETPPTWRP